MGSAESPPVPPRRQEIASRSSRGGADSNIAGTKAGRVPGTAPTMNVDVLQGTINQARRTQDLLMQRMLELRAGLVVTAEPWYVSERDARWFVSQEGHPLAVIVLGRGRTVVTSPDLGKRWGQLWSNTKNVLDGNGSSVIEKCVALYIPALAPVLGYVRAWFSLNTRIRVVSLLNSMMMNQTVILVKLFLWMPEY
ncbi:hypothetical protein M0802_012697 [Mischocyttarus mexicanus]|nr:hypothetical protein M0802_012697 [Mischocyttarus mexicanus]